MDIYVINQDIYRIHIYLQKELPYTDSYDYSNILWIYTLKKGPVCERIQLHGKHH